MIASPLGITGIIRDNKAPPTHTINRPTVVCIPKDFPHCPLVTKKVDSPKGFGFYLVCLNPNVVSKWLGPDIIKEKGEIPRTTGDKYSHQVKPLAMNFATLSGMLSSAGGGAPAAPGTPPIPSGPGGTGAPPGPGPPALHEPGQNLHLQHTELKVAKAPHRPQQA